MNVPVRHSDFIGLLCEALAHRWEPERLFMILTLYLDESGTHAGADPSIMAGFLGDARQWRKFEKRTGKLFKRFGVDIFHSIDVRRTDEDFTGWSVDRKIEFLDEFHHVINETLERGFAAILTQADYAYYCDLPWPLKARKDSKYALLFRACMAAAIDEAITHPRWGQGQEPRLHVVLENGHKNANDALRVYEHIKQKFGGVANKALSGLTFSDKESCLPLGAADLFAYSVYGDETGAKPIGEPKGPLKSDRPFPGNLYRVPLVRDSLLSLYERAVDLRISG